jgi:predicted nucleic acid-binding protein
VATYFDSSAVLEVLLGDTRSDRIIDCWADDGDRVSSILLEAECVTVLRRIEQEGRALRSSANTRKRLEALERYLAGVTIREVDSDVLAVLKQLPVLSSCRSLDAVHLATAMLFQQHLDEPLKLCALDERMRAAGAKLRLAVVPA